MAPGLAEFSNRNFYGKRVQTVDSFQGGEQSIVIFDIVVSKIRFGNAGFITDPRKFNVTLIRGRDSTLVI